MPEPREEKVSIIIVTYNTLDYVQKCLNSVLAHTDPRHEIIIVDNASEPPTRNFVKSLGDRENVKLILNDENRLWSPANNQGLRAAAADSAYCLLLNSDVEVFQSHYLRALQEPMQRYPRVGISGTQFNFSPIAPTYGAIDGCCFLLRRRLIDEIGYLDERYPWNGAGAIFTFRAWSKGWYYYHVDDPCLLIHYGKRSRISNDTQLRNQKIDKMKVRREAGLTPRLDWWAYLQNRLGWFSINRKLQKYLAAPASPASAQR